MLLHRTRLGVVLQRGDRHVRPSGALASATDDAGWDALLDRDDLGQALARAFATGEPCAPPAPGDSLSPVGTQEVWAAGVTYTRSRVARKAEAAEAGGDGGVFYDRVYEADRPELFLKATPHRVVPPGGAMRLRPDSRWMVPEPELALCVNRRGAVVGYTIGNDLSCRDIEGENPLYLPQAKVWDGSAALGPALYVPEVPGTPMPAETEIALEIVRSGREVVTGRTTLAAMKRTPASLVGWLYRACSFPTGCFLMTGTGIVPEDDFSLVAGDEVRITIEPIGTLVNTMVAP